MSKILNKFSKNTKEGSADCAQLRLNLYCTYMVGIIVKCVYTD